jgi:hypothetical protein
MKSKVQWTNSILGYNMRAKTKQTKKTNKATNELNNRIKLLEAQLKKAEEELQPPIETQCCNLCKATLPLTEFRLLKNLKHTKGCLKCLQKRREKIKQKEKPPPTPPPTPEDTEGTEGTEGTESTDTDSDSSQGGPTIELFQLTEMIKAYCENNNTTVLNVARFNYPSHVGYIMSHFNRVRITRNHLAHPITPFEIETPQELIETLMQFKF